MNKTISLLAITSLALACNSPDHHPKPIKKPLGVLDDELHTSYFRTPTYSPPFVSALDDELHTLFTLKPIRPPTYPPPFFPEDDLLFNDDELLSLEKVGNEVEKALNFVQANPEIAKKAEEVIKKYAGNPALLKKDAKNAFKFASENPEIVKLVVNNVARNPEFVKLIVNNMGKTLSHDDELVNLDQLLKDSAVLRKDVQVKNAEKIAQSKAKLMQDIKESAAKNTKTFLGKEEEEENNFSLWSHVKKEIESIEHAVAEGV